MRGDTRKSLERFVRQYGVLIVAVLVTAALFVPGPAWVFLAPAALTAAVVVLINPKMVNWFLPVLRKVSTPLDIALSYERRCLEIRQVAQGLDHALKALNHPSLKDEELEGLVTCPPPDAEQDLSTCCEYFAQRIDGHPAAEVLELLCRDFHGEATLDLWQTQKSSDARRQELARILEASGRLPMTELIPWVLERLPGEFRLKLVEQELYLLNRLWIQLAGCTGDLRTAGIPAALDLTALTHAVGREAPKGLLHGDSERVSVSVLIRMSSKWIRDWAAGETLSERDARNLAMIGLGIFLSSSDIAATEGKPLLVTLACKVAVKQEALDVLLAYLWKISKIDSDTRPSLAALAYNWRTWLVTAAQDMGDGVMAKMHAALKTGLQSGSWPNWLPNERAIARIEQQSQDINDKLGRLLVASATGAADPRLTRTIRTLTRRATELKRMKDDLELFAGQCRPETRLSDYPESSTPSGEARASFRERAADLGKRLAELSDMLLAEAGTPRAYLITFDQSRGELANLIDSLEDLYDFGHYTRYSRIGLLRQGETFETFYRSFTSNLECELAKRATATPDKWKNIEITVQPISLRHRHDFATAAGKDLPGLPPGTIGPGAASELHLPAA